jgi:hypothetical protein
MSEEDQLQLALQLSMAGGTLYPTPLSLTSVAGSSHHPYPAHLLLFAPGDESSAQPMDTDVETAAQAETEAGASAAAGGDDVSLE